MWFLDKVSAKVKLIYQQFFTKEEEDVFNSFPNTFFTINGLRIGYNDDSVEIDRIIIGPCGIYCIQEIDYPGVISGDENSWIHEENKKSKVIKDPYELANKYQETIRQIIRKNEKYLFNDPLKSDSVLIYPIIVNISSTSRINLRNSPIPVIKSFDLKRIINLNSKEEILTTDECVKLGKILAGKNTNKNITDNSMDY